MREIHEAIDAMSEAARLGRWRQTVLVPCDIGEVRRLYARYEAARRYGAIEWAEPYAQVGPCYAALVGVTLAYSAFDSMRDAVFRIGRDWAARATFYATLNHDLLAPALAAADQYYPQRALQRRLIPDINRTLQREMAVAGPFDALLLGEAIRHTFVHGKLSPSGAGFDADALLEIAREYRAGLLTLIAANMVVAVADPIRAMLNGP